MKHNALENQIFDHYRKQEKTINNAIELLRKHNYKIMDVKGNLIKKNK